MLVSLCAETIKSVFEGRQNLTALEGSASLYQVYPIKSYKSYSQQGEGGVCEGVDFFSFGGERQGICKVIGWGHRVPPAGLPIEQVLGEYSLSLPS